ncbi:hypothetical protein IG631_20789 [Alternaria alternata]|nr:hypothetical protein IG631_20789 [Alternaria alternata]
MDHKAVCRFRARRVLVVPSRAKTTRDRRVSILLHLQKHQDTYLRCVLDSYTFLASGEVYLAQFTLTLEGLARSALTTTHSCDHHQVPSMKQPSADMSNREDYFRFLDLPAELRNRVYDLAAETQADLPRCVLPCLALAQACQQLRIEYRPICTKRDIIIDWEKVPGYMRTFFSTVNGKIENIELIPSSITIVTPWRGETSGNELQLDILPMIKVGLRQPDFTCNFIHDAESLKQMEVDPYNSEDSDIRDPRDIEDFLDEDTAPLRIVMNHRGEEWTSDIETGRITKLLLCNIGVYAQPQALFYVEIDGINLGDESDDVEESNSNMQYAYFERVGLLDIWPGEFSTFPFLVAQLHPINTIRGQDPERQHTFALFPLSSECSSRVRNKMQLEKVEQLDSKATMVILWITIHRHDFDFPPALFPSAFSCPSAFPRYCGGARDRFPVFLAIDLFSLLRNAGFIKDQRDDAAFISK